MTDSATQPTKTSSSTRTIIIVVVAVVILAGAGFVVYKLTDKKDSGTPAVIVAQTVRTAANDGNQATIVKYTTAEGRTKLVAMKGQLGDLKFAKCVPNPYAKAGKVCTFTRPGGQLDLVLTMPNGKWLVDGATLGAAGLPPTTPPTT